MRQLTTLFCLVFFPLFISAQDARVTGKIIDRDTKEPVELVTVQLLNPDSTFVVGSLTDEMGNFSIKREKNKPYILRFSSVGYETLTKNVKSSSDSIIHLGEIIFGSDAIMLKGTTVTAQAAKVVVKEDTFVYNSSAYRTPEGSAVEELVKRLPGAQVDDDGKITINGKEVKKIRVDGKEFMTGDTQTALKNLPTSIIDKIKAYDEKSDLARVTGIDDGEEQTVLDFGIKPGMNKGVMANVDAGIGTHSRYALKGMGAVMKDDLRAMIFANANNVNDMGFPGGGGRGQFGRGQNGLNTAKMIATNINYEKKDTLRIDGSLRWNHRNGDTRAISSTENFVSTSGAFSNSISQTNTRSNSWNAQARLEWTPDSMTNIMFRPSLSLSSSDSKSSNHSATYNSDPYDFVDDPLSAEAIETLRQADQMVNQQQRTSISYSDSKSANAMLQYNRKLNSKGRNVTLRTDLSYSKGKSRSLSLNNVHLYQVKDAFGNDSTYQTNRYNETPTKNWSYALQATYSEPIWKATFLQFRYKFTYSFSKSDRATYDFSNVDADLFGDLVPVYRDWNSYTSRLNNDLDSYYDNDLSRFSQYKNYTHDFEVLLRFIRDKYRLNFGFLVQPQRSHFEQDYQGIKTDTVRTVVNFSPTFDFRYRFNKISNLRINYRGTTSQPSMTDLLDITDDSDPLNITKGNPGLKPSFTNRLRVFYNTYREKFQQSLMTFVNFSTTRNSISSSVTYDEITGARTTKPENINGNWNANLGLMLSSAVDSAGYWNINTFTNASYNNYVAYLALDQTSSSVKNTTRSLSLMERLEGTYRNEWLEIGLDGSVNYTHSRNKLQSQSDLDTWQFSYGGSINITAPWGTSFSTDLHENSRRGFSDAAMNTNELVWNAQIAHSFLKGKPLTVSLQFYDILQQQSSISRTINSLQRTDTEYNAINSYAMLHVIYRLNLFGGRDARRGGHDGPPMGGPGGGRRGRGGFGGPPPGGGGFGGPR